jgi:hypothetical protein
MTALALGACSSLPVAPVIEIQPADPSTLDALRLDIQAGVEDVDGAEVADLAGAMEVSADRTAKHQQWRAVVFAKNSKDQLGEAAEATTTVLNTLPTVEVSVEPSVPTVSQELQATPTGADVDEDELTYRYLWLRDGEATGNTDATLSADETVAGDKWTVRVWPVDDDGEGEPAEASVGVENTLPVALSVTLTPVEAYEDSVLTAEPQGEDEDGDELSWTFEWFANGEALPDVSGENLDGSSFSKGDEITVRVTPNDGISDGDSITSDVIVILNSAPTSSETTLGPDPAYEASTLTCNGMVFDDLDGDTEDWRFTWQVDGTDVSGTAQTMEGADFAKGNVVTCAAAPFDGDVAGDALRSAELTISNTAPVLTKATIDNATPMEGDTLSVVTDGVSDDDGDDVEFGYVWTVDGTKVGTSATLGSELFNKGDDIQVEVTPFDGTDYGTPVKSAVVTAVNTPPVAKTVTLSPPTPKTDEDVVATVETGDLDGDKVKVNYAWYVNGKKVSAAGDTLSGSTFFDKGDSIYVVVTPNDGEDDGADLKSTTIKAGNTLPSITGVNLSPIPAFEGSTVVCTPTGWKDADSDKEGYKYSWTVNGKAVGAKDRIDGASFSKGDKVVCSATPTDGDGDGDKVASKALVISNTAPTIASVALSSKTPKEGETLSARISGSKDDDGDKVSFGYTWYVNGGRAGSTATLNSSEFNKGDKVWVVVVPTDGVTKGKGVQSDTAIVANTAPSIASVTLSPTSPRTDQSVSAATKVSDVDPSDKVSLKYDWYVNGKKASATGSTLPSTMFVKGNSIYVAVTASDGTDSSTKNSATIKAVNSKPSITSATLTPAKPSKLDTMKCTPSGWVDADKDTAAYRYQWVKNKVVISREASATLASSQFKRGDVVQCRITPFDGTDTGAVKASNVVTVVNAAPSIAGVTLSPASPVEGSTIKATMSGVTDVDGDSVKFRYAWYVDSKLVSSAATINGKLFNKGQSIFVRVTPFDGFNNGKSVDSKAVMAANTAPTISSITLSPTSPLTTQTVSAIAVYKDVDGADKLSVTWAWYVNDRKVSATGSTLPSSLFVKNNSIYAVVTVSDGTAKTSKKSAVIKAINSKPTLASAGLTPAKPTRLNTLTCTPSGAMDADKDKISYRYLWLRNKVVIGRQTSSTLAGTQFSKGHTIQCRVTPFDGTDLGTFVNSNVVTIGNAAPSIGAVSLSPTSPKEASTINVSMTGVTDADGDSIKFIYAWYVDSKLVSAASTLKGDLFNKNQSIYVNVTPTDGFNKGKTVASPVIKSVNTAPVVTGVSLAPNPTYTTTTLAASQRASDGDMDKLTFKYAWYVNDALQKSVVSTLDKSLFKKADRVYVRVTASDGETTGSRKSVVRTISNSAPTRAGTPAVTPKAPIVTQNLNCTTAGATDADGDAMTYYYAWYRDSRLVGTWSTSAKSHVLSSTYTTAGQTFYCKVRARDKDGLYGVWSANSPIVTIIGKRDGQARKTDGTWVDVTYQKCGSGSSCNATQAKKACTDVSRKVVSHASDGTTDVFNLGATNSCMWSTSYFKVNKTMATGDCLVGVSNLEWSGCCGTSSWHGNTMKFGAASTIFGYVYTTNTGYVASYSNVTGTKWGCSSESTAASQSGCTTMYVACTN